MFIFMHVVLLITKLHIQQFTKLVIRAVYYDNGAIAACLRENKRI